MQFAHGKCQDGPNGPIKTVKIWRGDPIGKKHISHIISSMSRQISNPMGITSRGEDTNVIVWGMWAQRRGPQG